MCGRITLSGTRQRIEERFTIQAPKYAPTYNGAPTQLLPAILDNAPRVAAMCRWGLIPHWESESPKPKGIINARAETVSQKPAFAKACELRHCLILADGFYEWKIQSGEIGNGKKVPYRITLSDKDFFAMAGIWNPGKETDANPASPATFAILTTPANNQMKEVHERMPVILCPKEERMWLTDHSPASLKLLKPYQGKLTIYPVSSLVNAVKNNSPSLIEQVRIL